MTEPDRMTGVDVMRIAEGRGFRLFLKSSEPPMPCLWGDPNQVTEALLEALKAYREEIIEELRRCQEAKP